VRFFGNDGHAIALAHPAVPGVVLHYGSFRQIARDVDAARVYGGIHFRFDQEAGKIQGLQVGAFVASRHLRRAWGFDDDHADASAEDPAGEAAATGGRKQGAGGR
jgi:hypothetical protein